MNPYETGSPIPNFSPIINNFVDNLVRLKTHQADIDMRGRQLAEQQRQFDIELPIKQREASVKEGNLDVARGNLGYHNRQLQMQTPEHLQPIKPSKVAMEFQKFKTAYGPAGDAFKSIYDEINNVAEAAPETTNLDAYEHAKVIWPAKRDDVISRLEKQITSEDFAKLPPTQQEAITNLYDMVKYDKTGDKVLGGMLFRRTAASKQQEDAAAKIAHMEQVKGLIATKAMQGIPLNDAEKAIIGIEGKNQTEEQLTARALRGDTEAQKILDAMQKRKLEYANANRTIIDNSKAKEIDVPALAQSIIDGQDAPMAIKGSMGNPVATKVKTEILKKHPKFNMAMADANYKWKQSATNQRTINFAGGALPRLAALDDQLSALPNVDLNTINRIMRAVSVEAGKPEYTNYESNRNAIVQEVNTALSGSSQSSDMRVKIELDNLKSARSPAQIRGAISNLREALIARMDVDLSPLYPIEVVRGEKTMEQHKNEIFRKYRGNYGIASQKGGASGISDTAPSTTGGRKPLSAY